VAEGITEPPFEASALQKVAVALTQVGDAKQAATLFEEAWNAAESTTDPIDKNSALGDLAAALSQTGAAGKDTKIQHCLIRRRESQRA
jgi:hypothetical protein